MDTPHYVQLGPNNSVDENFWVLNPQLKYVSPFNLLYKRDKSKDQTKSSGEMWSVFLYTDSSPLRNKLYRIPEPERKAEIKEHYFDINFDDKVIKECIEAYPRRCLTAAERSFKSLEDKLDERERYMNNTNYSDDTARILESMLSSTEKIYSAYETVKGKMFEEAIKLQGKGNRKIGKNESGAF